MEQHEKGFQKVVRQTDFLVKDLDLDIFDPFKDVKDGVQLDEEDIVVAEEEAADEGQGAAEHGDDTCD